MTNRWKAVIAVGAGILVSYLWTCGDKPATSERGDIVVPTGDILQDEYSEYNKMYFGNTLPYVTIAYMQILNAKGEHEVMADVEHKNSMYHIRVDKTYNPVLKIADMSLLHEICHIKLDASGEVPLTLDADAAHGEKFQGCMIDLASRGAFHDLW